MEQKVSPHVTIKMVKSLDVEDGKDVGFMFDIQATNPEMLLMLGAYVSQIERLTGLDFNEIIYFIKSDHKMKTMTHTVDFSNEIRKAVDPDGKT